MEVVVGVGGIVRWLGVGLLDADVLEAVPLEEHLSGLDVHLLHDPFPRRAVLTATDNGQIHGHSLVGGQERGVLRGDQELVEVTPIAWGKHFTLSSEEARELYPMYDRFNEIRRELDPKGTLANEVIQELFG